MPTDTTRNYKWKRKYAGSCAKTSFRVRRVKGGKVLLRFCCPKGRFSRGVCKTKVKLQAIGKKKAR